MAHKLPVGRRGRATSLKDSVVVITGASSGIGRATAIACAREGAALVLAARREGPLHEAAAACEAAGGRAIAVPTEVADEPSVQRLAEAAVRTFGRIDVWVNNAGVGLFGKIEEVPMDAFRRVIDINLLGYVHGARAAIPIFRRQGGGVLINNAPILGRLTQPLTSAYVASKHAVLGLTEALRMELRDSNIEVCAVLPAAIDTPFFQHGANYTGRAVQPTPPVYTAEEVAATIVRVARRPRPQVHVGSTGPALAALRAVAPGLFRRIMARQTERGHRSDRPAATGPGTLFQPMAEGADTSGGWNGKSVRHRARWLLALGAGLGAGAWYFTRRPESATHRATKALRRLAQRAA